MNTCQERKQLLKSQQEAFGEWYKRRSELERVEILREHSSVSNAQAAADEAYKELRHCMDAVLRHENEHACNKGRC